MRPILPVLLLAFLSVSIGCEKRDQRAYDAAVSNYYREQQTLKDLERERDELAASYAAKHEETKQRMLAASGKDPQSQREALETAEEISALSRDHEAMMLEHLDVGLLIQRGKIETAKMQMEELE